MWRVAFLRLNFFPVTKKVKKRVIKNNGKKYGLCFIFFESILKNWSNLMKKKKKNWSQEFSPKKVVSILNCDSISIKTPEGGFETFMWNRHSLILRETMACTISFCMRKVYIRVEFHFLKPNLLHIWLLHNISMLINCTTYPKFGFELMDLP